MSKSNFIRCRFCGWKTVKFSKTSTPNKAFARLRVHIDREHFDESERIENAANAFGADVEQIISGMPQS